MSRVGFLYLVLFQRSGLLLQRKLYKPHTRKLVQGKTVHASNRTLAENKPSNGEQAGFAWRKYAAYVYFRFIQHAAFALMRLYKYKEVCLLVES